MGYEDVILVMELLHYILILLQLVIIVLLLTFSVRLYLDDVKMKERETPITREEYEEWKKENNIR